jgi:predicted Rossmann fold nucleotide-binding protein DprA/Smf involved in DNA uptake
MVARKLSPGSLLEMDGPAIATQLGLSGEQAERITHLLGRGVQLAVELERLGSLGIWALTRSDEAYPLPLKKRLGTAAPPVLFGAGDQTLLTRGVLAVVGSRDLDEAGERFAAAAGEACARSGQVLVSGGARGADRLSMGGCLNAGGSAIGVLADSLERVLREPEYRSAVAAGRLTLVTAVHPRAPFSVSNAMARNKYIYCLARYGLVVSSSLEKGGTRTGALEVLKQRWVPLFVRTGETAPAGNQDLIQRGALPFPAAVPGEGLAEWLVVASASWAAPTGAQRKGLVTPAPALAADDLFPVVWPHIAERLEKWPSYEELARHLCVDVAQLRAWVERAAELGILRASSRQAAAEQIRFEV